jgi:glycosyltransferase 2 family protein
MTVNDVSAADPPRQDGALPHRPSRAGVLGFLAKIAISAGLILWIFAHVDREALIGRLSAASWEWLALGFVVKSLTVPMAAMRWRAVAALVGLHFRRIDSLRLTVASLFLGQALPGALGGDLVRGWMTVRMGFPVSGTMLALLVDRVAALLGVVALLLAGLAHLTAAAAPGLAAPILAAAAVVCAGATTLFYLDRLPTPRFLRRPSVAALRGMIADMRGALRRHGGASLGWSIGVHVCTVVAAWLFSAAIGMNASFMDCLAVVPFTIIAAALPISLAGWGVREGSMAAGFALIGASVGDAVAVSLLIGVSVLLISLPGAPIWLFWRRSPGANQPSPLRATP